MPPLAGAGPLWGSPRTAADWMSYLSLAAGLLVIAFMAYYVRQRHGLSILQPPS